jgi:hypothetical protein
MAEVVMRIGDDLREATTFFRDALLPAASARGWDGPAAGLQWTCRITVDHVASCLIGYSAGLASGATTRRRHPVRNEDRTATPDDLLDIVAVGGQVLAAVAEATPPDRRAFHAAGMADADGFVAMGCDEVLVHGHDVARALQVDFDPPSALAGRVTRRLFPWAPADRDDPWATLLWANGRAALPDLPPIGSDWRWHCAPVEEWNGEIPRRPAST